MGIAMGCGVLVFVVGIFLLGMKYGRVLEAKAQEEARQLKLNLKNDLKKL